MSLDTTYEPSDRIDALSPSQLDLIARTDNGILLRYLELNTIFDVHRIRLMLELGAVEARRLLAENPITAGRTSKG